MNNFINGIIYLNAVVFMALLNEQTISCPYCGELIDVIIVMEDIDQQYIEDCQVCCQPITLVITAKDNDDLSLAVYAENDSF